MAKCVDCGYLAGEHPDDLEFVGLTELERYRLRLGEDLDEGICCFVEFKGFAWERVHEAIDCPFYTRRVPGLTPREHVDMRQIVEARQEAKEAAAIQRRESRIIAVLTVAVTVAAIIVAALIGRGIILG